MNELIEKIIETSGDEVSVYRMLDKLMVLS